MNTKEIFKDFLINNKYHIMHESDVNNQLIEHFFVLFQMKDILKVSPTKDRDLKEAEIILTYLDSFQKVCLMQNISINTIKFTQMKKNKLIYIPLESLDKSHHFYLKRKKELEDNYENFLAIKMLGEPADSSKHFNYSIDSKISDIKDISLGISSFAKEIVQEKSPILKQKILNLSKKIKFFKK